jgi:hypothetical protein
MTDGLFIKRAEIAVKHFESEVFHTDPLFPVDFLKHS